MSFTPGTRLGPYEILRALGAGGMGEVYRTTDTKLGRDVAIKITARRDGIARRAAGTVPAREGFIHFLEGDWRATDIAYRRAIELHPRFVQALGSFGLILSVRHLYYTGLPGSDPLRADPRFGAPRRETRDRR